MSVIGEKFKSDYNKYLDEYETSEWMDVDAHTKWSLRVRGLIQKIEKLEKENNLLYGKLNIIQGVLEEEIKI